MQQYHYVYRITNLLTNEFYIGSRTCRKCLPEEDVNYWGSSRKMTRKLVDSLGRHNFIKEVLGVFDKREDANAFEDKKIVFSGFNREKSNHNPLLLNAQYGNHAFHICRPSLKKGIPMSEEQKRKISASKKGTPSHRVGKKHSEETKNKISQRKKGVPHTGNKRGYTKEQRQKYADIMKGNVPWNAGKIGCFSEETKRKMSESAKGRILSPETVKKMIATRKKNKKPRGGWKHAEECKAYLREISLGQRNPFYGKSHTKQSLEKMSLAHRGRKLSPESVTKRESTRKINDEKRKEAGISRRRKTGKRIMSEEEISKRRGKKQSVEWIAKRTATRARNRALKEDGSSVNITISGD